MANQNITAIQFALRRAVLSSSLAIHGVKAFYVSNTDALFEYSEYPAFNGRTSLICLSYVAHSVVVCRLTSFALGLILSFVDRTNCISLMV